VFAEGLDTPTSILFTEDGDIIIADSGYISGIPTLSRLINGQFEIIANNFNVPLTGINYRNGDIYVSHRGTITVIRRNGIREDLITGLPSYGDYSNSRVAFGADNKMYFGQGTATNSGIVGEDNFWVFNQPFFRDNPGSYIMLNGQNFETNNMLIRASNETALTGAFSPYGVSNIQYEVRKGVTRASGSILRANPDGTELELVAWGLRSPSYLRFDERDRLFVSNDGFDVRGSRPIANAPDEFQLITPGTWYGWPDYAGGEPVTSSRFRPEGGIQPEFLLVNHPGIPPRPFATFPPDATIIGFDFNYNSAFGSRGDVYIAEFGFVRPSTIRDIVPSYTGIGHRISRIDMSTGGVTTFAINKSGFPSSITREGGFGRPADVVFGPDGAMYIVDMGTNAVDDPYIFIPRTGVIWRVTRNQ
jgi:glucose/arabinose dehydrogenase